MTDVDEADSYDCVWFPTFFVTEIVLEAAVPRLVRSLQEGRLARAGPNGTAARPAR